MIVQVQDEPSRDGRPIACLRRVATALGRLQAPHPADAGWLIAGFQRYEAAKRAGVHLTLDAALGLGVTDWHRDELRQRRDVLLCELHARHFADLAPGPAATAICALARRVELDSPAADNDDEKVGLIREALLRGQSIPGQRQVKRILQTGHQY